MKAIVVSGTLVEGFSFYGPFESPMDALAWADTHSDATRNMRLIVTLVDPEVKDDSK